MPFLNRTDAGRRLARHLSAYANRPDVIVLALPRGGVPVAYEVARELRVPLDVLLVRKLGVPGHEELAMGAIASGGIRSINEDVVRALRIPPSVIDSAAVREQVELQRREELYRGNRPKPSLADKIVILVDDGLATGSTMHASVGAVRQGRPARVVVGVPVAAASVCEDFRREVDEVICLETPDRFQAVSLWYEDFRQITDSEIRELLDHATPAASGGQERHVTVSVPNASLEGDLSVPADARGIVLFAHGSGSSRHSPRNRRVARALRESALATLLIDLLTPQEEELDLLTAHLRFDIGLLAERLIGATDWLGRNDDTRNLPVGYFGASTGAAAALVAAAQRPKVVHAVVSRGGRPDLAGGALSQVQAPTLLIVGGEDYPVIRLNQQAMEQLKVEKRMQIIPGAGHLFEEPGALEQVAHFAARWFNRYLAEERADVA